MNTIVTHPCYESTIKILLTLAQGTFLPMCARMQLLYVLDYFIPFSLITLHLIILSALVHSEWYQSVREYLVR